MAVFEGLTPDLSVDARLSVLFSLLQKLKGGKLCGLEPTCLKGFLGGKIAFLLFRSPARSSLHPALTWCRVSCSVTESSHQFALEMALNVIVAAVRALLRTYLPLWRCFGDSLLTPAPAQSCGCAAGVWASTLPSPLFLHPCGG